MGLDDAARFGTAITLLTLAWPAFALLLAWPRRAPAETLRWCVSGAMGALAFTIHFQMLLGAYSAAERGAAIVGLGLCMAIAARLGSVTSGLGGRWPMFSSAAARALGLLTAWGFLAGIIALAFRG